MACPSLSTSSCRSPRLASRGRGEVAGLDSPKVLVERNSCQELSRQRKGPLQAVKVRPSASASKRKASVKSLFVPRTDFDNLTGDCYAGHTLLMHLTLMRGDPAGVTGLMQPQDRLFKSTLPPPLPPPPSTTPSSTASSSRPARPQSAASTSSSATPNIHEIGKNSLHRLRLETTSEGMRSLSTVEVPPPASMTVVMPRNRESHDSVKKVGG